eukprot:6435643-Lingulodinium_polyedra.AAC.1
MFRNDVFRPCQARATERPPAFAGVFRKAKEVVAQYVQREVLALPTFAHCAAKLKRHFRLRHAVPDFAGRSGL